MIRLFIIGCLFLMPLTAISQPPAPTPSETVKKPNADTAKKQNNSQVTTPIGTSVPDKPSTISSDDKHEGKTSPEWWLVYITGALVLATGGLMVYTALLWRSTKTLSEEAKETSARQASEMIKSLALTKESLDLARKEFISTHRPRLIIRGVTIKPHTHPSLLIEPGKPIMVEAVVVNTGNSPAEIFNSNATILVGGRMFGARTPFGPALDHFNGINLVPGGAYTIVLTADKVHFVNAGQYSPVRNGEQVIYFFGYIMYRDEIGNERRTTFCRRYDPNAERFILVDNPDYEHAD
jgi:hypothetical protein